MHQGDSWKYINRNEKEMQRNSKFIYRSQRTRVIMTPVDVFCGTEQPQQGSEVIF